LCPSKSAYPLAAKDWESNGLHGVEIFAKDISLPSACEWINERTNLVLIIQAVMGRMNQKIIRVGQPLITPYSNLLSIPYTLY
jgi:hypothetical protein